MNRRSLLVVGLGLLVILAILWWRSRGETRSLSYYSPDDYVLRANRFIDGGYLQAVCSAESIRIETHLQSAPETERAWYENSYLSGDVARFNEDPRTYGWTFLIDPDCVIRGVNPVVHRVLLPFSRSLKWRGSILYGGPGSDAVLRSSRNRTVTLLHPKSAIPARDEVRVEIGGEGRVSSTRGGVLLHYGGGVGHAAARIYHVSTGIAALQNRSDPDRNDGAWLMGHRLPVGRIVRLETGDWIHFASGVPDSREETFVFVGGEAFETASTIRIRNDRRIRDFDDPELGWTIDRSRDEPISFLELLASAIDASLDSLPDDRATELAEGFDLQITIDRSLQEDVSRLLGQRVASLPRSRSSAYPIPAAVTVMDGKTGHLLALATSPRPRDLEAATDVGTRLTDRLLMNQNFRRHPIGSAGKPFFFAAIADAHPFLLDLVIEGHGPKQAHRELLQCELSSGYQLLDGHYDRIDFRGALEISCNKYTVELGTLALAARRGVARGRTLVEGIEPELDIEWPKPGHSSGIFIRGAPLIFAPAVGDYLIYSDRMPVEAGTGAVRHCQAMDKLEYVPFRASFEEITGAATYRGRTPPQGGSDITARELESRYSTNWYDLRPWAPLLAHLMDDASDETAWGVRAAIQGASPERVDLQFNQITRLREEYLSLLLGGATSSWTNVQLAESLSRLVTGRAVQATLVAAILERSGDARRAGRSQQQIRMLDLREEARSAVLEGIGNVVEGKRGTARSLAGDLRSLRSRYPKDRILMYSKTGSPTVLHPVPARLGAALLALVAHGHVAVEGERARVRSDAELVPSGSGSKERVRAMLVRSLREEGFGGDAARFALEVMEILDELNEQLASTAPEEWEKIDGPLYVERGRLRVRTDDDLFTRRLRKGRGAVYIFTLVRLPGRADSEHVPTPSELSIPDARVMTTAVYLETGPNSQRAVETARVMFERIGRLLE